MSALVLTLALGLSAFDIATVPAGGAHAEAFLAQGVADRADVYLLDGDELTRVPVAKPDGRRRVDLGGISAFDIADLDGDGNAEVLAIRGAQVCRIALEGEPAEAEVLFSRDTLFSGLDRPFRHILAVPWEESTVLALPTAGALVLCDPDGTERARFDADASNATAALGSPFLALPAHPPQVAEPGGLEYRVSALQAYQPRLPEGVLPDTAPPALLYRRGTQRQTREALERPPESWPWFPLYVDATRTARVFHALADERTTVLRVRQPSVENPGAEVRMGAPRRYPGSLLWAGDALPDFDGDGAHDILLWQAAPLTPSVGAVTRGLMSHTWPLKLLLHRFDPAKKRYEPRPYGVIDAAPPVAWYLETPGEAPLRHLVLDDLNGDGRTDLAFAPAPGRYEVWLAGEKDVGADGPSCLQQLSSPLRGIAFQGDMTGQGKVTLGLRTEEGLVLITPQ